MKKIIFAFSVLCFSALSFAGDFTVTSSSWKEGDTIGSKYVFNGFGCTGGNVSPQVSWKNAPANTKSFAITIHDPDAPTGSGWWHWIVYNIPANVKSLSKGEGKQDEGRLANGAFQGKTDYGSVGYGGPCPPAGDKPHHYNLTVFALDVEKLDVPLDATAALIGFKLNAHKLAKATMTSTYSR